MGKINIAKVAGAVLGVLLLRAPVNALEINATRIGDNPNSNALVTIDRAIDGVSYAVSATFRYTISEEDDNPAPVDGFPKNAEISFVGEAPNDNRVFQSTVLDWSQASFSEVGDYVFRLRESSSSSSTRYPIDHNNYYVRVYVRNVVDENGFPTGGLEATLDPHITMSDGLDKYTSATFASTAVNTYIEVSNTVKGGLADPNKYFKYKVDLSNFPFSGEHYYVTGQDKTVDCEGESFVNAMEFVSGSNENYVCLKHGQTIRIGQRGDLFQVPIGGSYSVELTPVSDYTSTLDGVETYATDTKTTLAIPGPNAKQSTKDKFAAANTTLGVNAKGMNGIVATGVISKSAPYVLILVIGGMACFVLSYSRKERKE